MLGQQLVYTVFHESAGHSSAYSQHAPKGKSDYRQLYKGDKGIVATDEQPIHLPDPEDKFSQPDIFAHFHNEISRGMRMLKTDYPEIQALLDNPVVKADMKNLYQVAGSYHSER